MKKVIGYVRVSTRPQAKRGASRQAKNGASLRDQEARIQGWAKLHGAESVTIFSDPAQSGWCKDRRKKRRRPGLEAAIAALGKGDVLAAYSLSRVGRSARDLLDLADTVEAKGAELVSMCEDVSTKGAAGQMFFTVLAAVCEYQSTMHSERIADVWHDKRALGERANGGPYCPFGYSAEGKRLVKDDGEQRVIKKVKTWRGRGASFRAIARKLEAQGVRRKAGGQNWCHTAVSRLVTRQA
jgi:DNA invertase Pin-like site-specific DNA recombinase